MSMRLGDDTQRATGTLVYDKLKETATQKRMSDRWNPGVKERFEM